MTSCFLALGSLLWGQGQYLHTTAPSGTGSSGFHVVRIWKQPKIPLISKEKRGKKSRPVSPQEHPSCPGFVSLELWVHTISGPGPNSVDLPWLAIACWWANSIVFWFWFIPCSRYLWGSLYFTWLPLPWWASPWWGGFISHSPVQ